MNNIVRENGIDVYGPKNSFRAAAKLKLIDNPADWFKFLLARNYTVHTYDEKTAQWVYSLICHFPPLVETLLVDAKQYITPSIS